MSAMKKMFMLMVAAAMALTVLVPSSAMASEHDKNCSVWHNPAGGKTLHACSVNVASVDGDIWWGRGLGWVEGNEDSPYRVTHVVVAVWSRVPGSNNYCEGRAPSCTGGGDATASGPFSTWPNTQGSAREWNTDHYDSHSPELRCLIHTETLMQIWWTQSDWDNLQPDWRHVNSGESNANEAQC